MKKIVFIFMMSLVYSCGPLEMGDQDSSKNFDIGDNLNFPKTFTQKDQSIVSELCDILSSKASMLETSNYYSEQILTYNIQEKSCDDSNFTSTQVNTTILPRIDGNGFYFSNSTMNKYFSYVETQKKGIFTTTCKVNYSNQFIYDQHLVQISLEKLEYEGAISIKLLKSLLDSDDKNKIVEIENIKVAVQHQVFNEGYIYYREKTTYCGEDSTTVLKVEMQ
jgi:hypothetical protein